MVTLSHAGVQVAMLASQLESERATLGRLQDQREDLESKLLALATEMCGIDRRIADVEGVIAALSRSIRKFTEV